MWGSYLPLFAISVCSLIVCLMKTNWLGKKSDPISTDTNWTDSNRTEPNRTNQSNSLNDLMSNGLNFGFERTELIRFIYLYQEVVVVVDATVIVAVAREFKGLSGLWVLLSGNGWCDAMRPYRSQTYDTTGIFDKRTSATASAAECLCSLSVVYDTIFILAKIIT